MLKANVKGLCLKAYKLFKSLKSEVETADLQALFSCVSYFYSLFNGRFKGLKYCI